MVFMFLELYKYDKNKCVIYVTHKTCNIYGLATNRSLLPQHKQTNIAMFQ